MKTYFELLGFQPSFNVDLASLESAYFKVQRDYHPDRFVGKPAEERVMAAQRSADINKAYETLKNPLTRAQYLLHLQGIEVGTDHDTVKPSQAILAETLEWREEAEDPNEWPRLIAMLKNEYNQALQTIAQAYGLKDWVVMGQETLRLGYIIKTQAAFAAQNKQDI